jgi:hypothetical protein
MDFDAHLSLGEIHKSQDTLVQQLQEIQGQTAIFTSADIAVDYIPRPLAKHNFVFEVLPVSVPLEPLQKLSHTSKWMNGMWYAPQSSRRKCLFPWG